MENPIQDHPYLKEGEMTIGQKAADVIASFGGSWKFIGTFAAFLSGWIIMNTFILPTPVDPYPYILLNLFLSMLASIQGPIIMMSQNRQEIRDRKHSELDLMVDMRTESIIQKMEVQLQEVHQLILAVHTVQIKVDEIEDKIDSISQDDSSM